MSESWVSSSVFSMADCEGLMGGGRMRVAMGTTGQLGVPGVPGVLGGLVCMNVCRYVCRCVCRYACRHVCLYPSATLSLPAHGPAHPVRPSMPRSRAPASLGSAGVTGDSHGDAHTHRLDDWTWPSAAAASYPHSLVVALVGACAQTVPDRTVDKPPSALPGPDRSPTDVRAPFASTPASTSTSTSTSASAPAPAPASTPTPRPRPRPLHPPTSARRRLARPATRYRPARSSPRAS